LINELRGPDFIDKKKHGEDYLKINSKDMK